MSISSMGSNSRIPEIIEITIRDFDLESDLEWLVE